MEQAVEEYRLADEPYYVAVARQSHLFGAAHAVHLPVILKEQYLSL